VTCEQSLTIPTRESMLSFTYHRGCIWQLCFVGTKEKERKGGEHGQREEDEALRAYHDAVFRYIGKPKGQ